MRILITGADGFVGPHLERELRAAHPDAELFRLVWVGGSDDGDARSFRIDLRDPDQVRRIVAEVRPDTVFHLAAASSVVASWRDPASAFAVNAAGTAHLLAAAGALDRVPLVVAVTSGEVYGQTGERRAAGEDDPLRPASPYAFSKAVQDRLLAAIRVPAVRLRPFLHTGPGQPDRFALPSFARRIAEIETGARPPVIAVGNLDAVRDVTDVRDVVRAYRLAARSDLAGSAFNVASGHGHRIGDLLDRLIALSPREIAIEVDPRRLRPSDTPRLVGDPACIEAATGWRPAISIERTLSDLLAWWRERVADGPGAAAERS